MAAVSGLVISATILLISYALGLWLGSNIDNLWLLLKLMVPLALLLGVVAAAWPEPNERRALTSPLALGILGVALACAFWYFVGRTWASWTLFGLALQAFACCIATAVSALLLTLGRRNRSTLLSAMLVFALAVVVPAPVYNFFSHNQALTVAFVVPEGLTGASAQPEQSGFHSQSEMEKTASQVLRSLQAAGIQGNYRTVYLSKRGEGKQSLAIIVVNASATGLTQLPEPDAAEVIYVQQQNGWAKIPAQAARE
jgi:hypothetical protein